MNRVTIRFLHDCWVALDGQPTKRRRVKGEMLWCRSEEAERLIAEGKAELRQPRGATTNMQTRDVIAKAAGEVKRLALGGSFGVVEQKAAGGRRIVRGTASNEQPDRHGDVVLMAGLDLTAFRRNPIALAHHDSTRPIGRCTEVGVEGDRLMVEISFMAEGIDEHADRVWRMCESGTLRGLSIGFLPVEAKLREGGRGFLYRRAELLEVSIVSVPSNRETLLSAALLPAMAADRPRLAKAMAELARIKGSCGDAGGEGRGRADNRRDRLAAEAAGHRASHRSPSPVGTALEKARRLDGLAGDAEARGRALLAARFRSLAAIVRDGATVRKQVTGGGLDLG